MRSDAPDHRGIIHRADTAAVLPAKRASSTDPPYQAESDNVEKRGPRVSRAFLLTRMSTKQFGVAQSLGERVDILTLSLHATTSCLDSCVQQPNVRIVSW